MYQNVKEGFSSKHFRGTNVKSCKEVPFLLISLFNLPSLTAKILLTVTAGLKRNEFLKEDDRDVVISVLEQGL